MSRNHVVPACALLALLALGTSATASAPGTSPVPQRPGPHGFIDAEYLMQDVNCNNAQLLGPAATSTSHVTGEDQVSLDVMVLVDVARGAQVASLPDDGRRAAGEQALFQQMRDRLDVATQSYEPVDIALRFARFQLLQPLVDGAPRERTDNADDIIELAKRQLGGQRPAGIDVVYVVTDMDIQLPGIGNGVAGLADCIGGVALPDRAFAVGETDVITGDEGIAIGPVSFYKDLTAKIAAHEVGHLMGGHHHYQECGTAAGAAAGRGEPGPCTIMSNFVDFQTLPFSTLNSVVVRGHAEAWAADNDH